ncbi:MAG: hypothetical protein A2887_01205 [Alphaproteobacteria bacterium RIFCSPLOWO2_01_FULL_40_26]|nr:MAG: hypothetical protein A3D15_05455 [Alphaproteobacteria bacterium RIFCSPHIGHO2_02_FULL_40_34]OFW88585.1 MAG: hypothetical protein A2794_00295 [Alphaproteobacteria bacterium RIFCSPHIGHO2_01_FULL_40_8]OFW94043.1 MAG: hypothetical protein A2887_01205 [Alphaproteobacteria bacterium RIFCSPLOWO2_01_FULL_40_26]OFX09577.1 MAG: hypothetical protein A3H30_05690 [Alphaproteobacteria bacterium RIFCSPLOWO2_02_FULL_40_19]OFX11006.1 MAG: hypothetical protein A3G22_00250 [Alphaproteobacteria bacterium RI
MPFDRSNSKNKSLNKSLLENLKKASENAGKAVNKAGGISSKRVNEVGNYIEFFVKKSLEKVGYKVLSQITKSGKNKSAGYPDVQFRDEFGRVCYLECKTFNSKNIATTQRSFYLSPSSDPKVNSDGFHFVLSFEIEPRAKKFYCASYKLLSIENLSCDLKHEFNSDNKRLYTKELILAEGRFL